MINWPEMLRHAEDWAAGFWAGAGAASLMGDHRGRDGAAHSRHLKPGSARLLAEGAVSVWRFSSGSGDGVRLPAVALPPLGPGHHHIDVPTFRTASTPSDRANQAPVSRRRTERPSRGGQARLDAGRLCTRR
jgi:hypothetical protein